MTFAARYFLSTATERTGRNYQCYFLSCNTEPTDRFIARYFVSTAAEKKANYWGHYFPSCDTQREGALCIGPWPMKEYIPTLHPRSPAEGAAHLTRRRDLWAALKTGAICSSLGRRGHHSGVNLSLAEYLRNDPFLAPFIHRSTTRGHQHVDFVGRWGQPEVCFNGKRMDVPGH